MGWGCFKGINCRRGHRYKLNSLLPLISLSVARQKPLDPFLLLRKRSSKSSRNLHHHDSDDPPRMARAAIPHCTRVYIFLKEANNRTDAYAQGTTGKRGRIGSFVGGEQGSDAAIVGIQPVHLLHYHYLHENSKYCADVAWALQLELDVPCRV